MGCMWSFHFKFEMIAILWGRFSWKVWHARDSFSLQQSRAYICNDQKWDEHIPSEKCSDGLLRNAHEIPFSQPVLPHIFQLSSSRWNTTFSLINVQAPSPQTCSPYFKVELANNDSKNYLTVVQEAVKENTSKRKWSKRNIEKSHLWYYDPLKSHFRNSLEKGTAYSNHIHKRSIFQVLFQKIKLYNIPCYSSSTNWEPNIDSHENRNIFLWITCSEKFFHLALKCSDSITTWRAMEAPNHKDVKTHFQ